ncbi:MAG: DUF1768 domain-containing protein [Clostridia bacterium]|nr:DUF1768 domain-containing protein [Clostridia bacterium]
MMKTEYALDGLLGLAVGDALGVPYEFSSREKMRRNPATDMVGFGTHYQPEGSWSDDTAMALCTADSLLKGLNPEDMMKKYAAWLHRAQYTAAGVVFDSGLTCRRAIDRYEAGVDIDLCGDYSEWGNGNGALMRIFPIALWQSLKTPREKKDTAQFLQPVHAVSSLTHGHERGLICCGIYTMILDEWLHSGGEETMLNAFSRGFERAKALYTKMGGAFSQEMNTPGLFIHPEALRTYAMDDLRASGYAVHTLHAALWCLLTTDNYSDCVLRAVNMGEDTDTTAAVAGSLAGVVYGRKAIPEKWMEALKNRKLVEMIAQKLDNAMADEKEEIRCIDAFEKEHAHMALKAPARIELDGVVYGNAQAAFLAQRVEMEERVRFAVLNAHQARRLAKQLAVRETWEQEWEAALYDVCWAKYAQNPELAQMLLRTDGLEIIYDTTGAHDNELGRCACSACAEKEARNLYGKTLMRVREALKK